MFLYQPSRSTISSSNSTQELKSVSPTAMRTIQGVPTFTSSARRRCRECRGREVRQRGIEPVRVIHVDHVPRILEHLDPRGRDRLRQPIPGLEERGRDGVQAVSYTHLTLPTSDLV